MPSYEKQTDRFDTHATHIFQPGRAVTDLDDFLSQKKPSTTKDYNGAHWIVVCRPDTSDPEPEPEVLDRLKADGKKILDQLEQRMEMIDSDDSIPKKSGKKIGSSKKVRKEEARAKAVKRLQGLAERTTTVGYWTFFSAASRVDKIFRTLSESLLEGQLEKTPAFMIKAHTSPAGVGEKYKHVVQVWYDDIFDETDARVVLDCLVEDLGQTPRDCRCELMRYLGLDRDDGLLDPWVHKTSEFFKSTEDLQAAAARGRENKKHKPSTTDYESEEDELASQPKKKKKGQLASGQVTLGDYFASASGSTPNRPSSSSQRKTSSSSGSSGGSNLGQGAYRLGGGSPGPGPSSSASVERRKKDEQRRHSPPIPPQELKGPKVKKEPNVVYAIDEDGAICLD